MDKAQPSQSLTPIRPRRSRRKHALPAVVWTHSKEAKIPVFVVSEANSRLATMKGVKGKSARNKAARSGAFYNCISQFGGPPDLEKQTIAVVLTAVRPHAFDDDNLVSAFKSVRDGIADWLRTNDNNPQIKWSYRHKKGPPSGCIVEVFPNVIECVHCASNGWVQA